MFIRKGIIVLLSLWLDKDKNTVRSPFWRERTDRQLQLVGESRLLYVRTVEKHNNEAFSYRLTQRILLSTICQQRPGCQQYGNQRFHNSMDLQPMTTSYCRHSPSLSREENVWHAFLRANIQELTFHQTNYCSRLQTIRWFRQSDRKPVGASFQTKKTQNICNLSLIPTQRILLSTLSLQRGKRVAFFPLISFRMLTF